MILLAGANGYLGRHVISQSTPGKLITTARRIEPVHPEFAHFPSRDEIDIRSLPWDRIRGVINVANRVKGYKSQLDEANVEFAIKLATAARSAGVRRFVQVSSFSVFGFTEVICRQSPVQPNSAYGRSKLKCELGLLALCGPDFEAVSVRLPFMFDEYRSSFLGPLIRFCANFSTWPSTAAGIRRSMMTFGDAARTLLYVVESQQKGQINAASPGFFEYQLLARLIREESCRHLKIFTVPNLIVAGTKKIVPSVHRRLFQSSILRPEDNIASTVPDIIGIEPTLRHLVRRYYETT
jgi:nucleoside-diphosphate-sugar epimerase